MRQLSLFEETSLERDEAIIERGLESFVEVGTALLHIRDNTLYQKTHDTFEDYFRKRWGMTRPRAYQLMDAAEVVSNLSKNLDISPPQTESHAQPLASLPPDQQREVWGRAVDTAPNGKMTAAHVKQVKAEMTAPATIVVDDVEDEEPPPTETQANHEEAAKNWTKTLSEVGIYLTSLERRGGIVFLTRHWTAKHRSGHADYIKRLIDSLQVVYTELKGACDGKAESR